MADEIRLMGKFGCECWRSPIVGGHPLQTFKWSRFHSPSQKGHQNCQDIVVFSINLLETIGTVIVQARERVLCFSFEYGQCVSELQNQ